MTTSSEYVTYGYWIPGYCEGDVPWQMGGKKSRRTDYVPLPDEFWEARAITIKSQSNPKTLSYKATPPDPQLEALLVALTEEQTQLVTMIENAPDIFQLKQLTTQFRELSTAITETALALRRSKVSLE